MAWIVDFHPAARIEAAAQPLDIRARLEHLVVIIEGHGLSHLPPKAAKHLHGGLWELRLTGRDGIARALYVTRSSQRLVIVRVFSKKTEKTPSRELELAVKRAKEVS